MRSTTTTTTTTTTPVPVYEEEYDDYEQYEDYNYNDEEEDEDEGGWEKAREMLEEEVSAFFVLFNKSDRGQHLRFLVFFHLLPSLEIGKALQTCLQSFTEKGWGPGGLLFSQKNLSRKC